MLNTFSDYDLSLTCTSKCDEAYLECVSTCSSSDCLMECLRAAVTCGDGKYLAYCISIGPSLLIKHVHAILIALMAVKDATTQFVSAM